MNLSKMIPERFLTYRWQEPKGVPYNPLLAIHPPQSRHAWLAVGQPGGDEVPTGAEILATPLQGDSTRGNITLWADWFGALGGTNTAIQIAALDTGDPVPAPFILNPTNTLAGRTYLVSQAADTAQIIATKITSAIQTMLSIAALDSKYLKLGGRILDNVVRADLGAGTVAIISPQPWRQCELQSLSGAFTAIMSAADSFLENPGRYQPEFLAGCRPAPWLVRGTASEGLGEDHGIIG
jgi:hypothetical protein